MMQPVSSKILKTLGSVGSAENWWIVSTWDFDLSKQEDIHPMTMGIAV